MQQKLMSCYFLQEMLVEKESCLNRIQVAVHVDATCTNGPNPHVMPVLAGSAVAQADFV